jgi:hypothetical protein
MDALKDKYVTKLFLKILPWFFWIIDSFQKKKKNHLATLSYFQIIDGPYLPSRNALEERQQRIFNSNQLTIESHSPTCFDT